MQNYIGYSAGETGLRQLSISGWALILGPIAGILSSRLRHGYMLAVSSFTIGIGFIVFSLLVTKTSTFNDVWPAFVILGIGSATLNPPMSSAAIASVKPHQIGMASGMISTMLQVGLSFGVVFQGLRLADGYQAGLKKHLPELVANHAPVQVVNTLQETLVKVGPFSGHAVATSRQIAATPFADRVQSIVRGAFDNGFVQIMRIDAGLLILGGILALLLVKTGGRKS
jgi:hypothetical protein